MKKKNRNSKYLINSRIFRNKKFKNFDLFKNFWKNTLFKKFKTFINKTKILKKIK